MENKMKTQKQKKAGFTLVELMVVAIIVAILAAVAIPMMSGNTENAIATEGQTGCSAVATQLRMYFVENGVITTTKFADLTGIDADDLKGTYFDAYEITSITDKNTYTITATGLAGSKAAGKQVTMTVVDGATTWSGLTDVAASDG
jgi:type IV pilus assembly protein PilA